MIHHVLLHKGVTVTKVEAMQLFSFFSFFFGSLQVGGKVGGAGGGAGRGAGAASLLL